MPLDVPLDQIVQTQFITVWIELEYYRIVE